MLVVLFSLSAAATPPSLLGMGSRSSSLGGAFTAVADDFSAVYYNPAGLAFQDKGSITLAPVYTRPVIWLEDHGTPQEIVELPMARGIYLGLSAPLGKLFNIKGLGLGFSLYMPFDFVVNASVPPRSNSRILPVLQDSYRRMSATLALAYEFVDSLSVGVGLDLFMDLGGGTMVAFAPSEHQSAKRQQLELDLRRDITLDPALFAGILYRPTDWVSVGLSYRMEERADTRFSPNAFDLAALTLDMSLHFVNFFSPHQVTLGLHFKPLKWLAVNSDVTWAAWSHYRSLHGEKVSPSFKDTWTPRLGIEATLTKPFKLCAGYFYAPTPVPDQTGHTNLVDNTRHGMSLGMLWDLRELPGIRRLPLSIDLHFTAQVLETRNTQKNSDLMQDSDPQTPGKQVNSPGYPSFKSGGYLVGGGTTVSVYF